MTISLTRPDMTAGPMLRKARPARRPSLRSGVLAAGGAGFAFGFGAGVWPRAKPAKRHRPMREMRMPEAIFFTGNLLRGDDPDYRKIRDRREEAKTKAAPVRISP